MGGRMMRIHRGRDKGPKVAFRLDSRGEVINTQPHHLFIIRATQFLGVAMSESRCWPKALALGSKPRGRPTT